MFHPTGSSSLKDDAGARYVGTPAVRAHLSGRRRPRLHDTHVHLTMDAADLALQTLQSSAGKALKGLSLAREHMNYGFTTTLIELRLYDYTHLSASSRRQQTPAPRSR